MTEAAAGEPRVRRWTAQRWALDNVLRSVGIDWDQPRSFYLNAACGIEAGADFAAIRERVKKYADIEPAFANTARRREAKARAAEDDGSPVTARDNYFMAAIHWGSAQWSHTDNDPTNLAYNKSKRDCYTRYAALADHKIEPVMIPFKGKALPGWFHLPPNYTGGRVPVYHFDFFRLEERQSVRRLGLDEYFFGDGISVVEWADKFPDLIPADARWISFDSKSETRRSIVIS